MSSSLVVSQRYHRQELIPEIGREGQRRLREARVCIIGIGALGTHVADQLARAGAGFLRLVDRDVPELTNLQRQVLFDEADVESATPKAIAAARRLGAINHEVELEPVVDDVNPYNVERLISDVDVVIDGSDNFELRYLLNDASVKLGRPWIYGGVIATHGTTMTIIPGETPCLRCVFPEPPPPGAAPTCDTAGVLGPAVAVIGALQAVEAIKLLTGNRDARSRWLTSFDVWTHELVRIDLPARNPECPTCGLGRYEFLDRTLPTQTIQLCGRDAVQVVVHPRASLSFPALAERLSRSGEVSYNRYLMRFRAGAYELTIFPDGRAIVRGTTDPAEARSIYARYIGM
ncbi:ThiF family adenylyltransferase [Thermomicrobiaceae bacterium CFH 74404]|uniref:ThiF family adenylyltransferase n=1 Tax=Thermalbibacter longus TaxID=2951981 RepID=A0AA41W9T3_9BACT|nr:ThiF family adenylyltransferase [Thermalbibacter longus]MCM8748002.1 ThiF family adenylyltransferase [Thermalbibacter longus]